MNITLYREKRFFQMNITGENISSIIVVTFVLAVYLNLSENNTTRYSAEKFVQENSIICNDQSQNDDKILDNKVCFDNQVLSRDRSFNTYKIVYDRLPISISDINESILLFIDLPPPLII